MAKNNARLRRLIAQILFHDGPMTRVQVCEALLDAGLFRDMPSESSLAALISKNAQVVSVGLVGVELSNGSATKNMTFDIDRDMVRTESDLVYTRPFSSMSAKDKRQTVRCSECKQLRLIRRGEVCLVCERKVYSRN